MPNKRMMINFDLDTNKYEALTHKAAPTAYYKIRRYMEKNDFLHRQGSCYVTNKATSRMEVADTIKRFLEENKWLGECVREIDISTIGKKYSLKDVVKSCERELETIFENLDTKELETTKDILEEIDLKLDK